MTERLESVRLAEPERISGRKWLLTFVGFLICSVVFLYAAVTLPLPTAAVKLVLLLIYTSLAFTFCPLPTLWILLWAARDIDPLSVALVGTLGTCVANLNDYHILHFLLRKEIVKKLTATRTFRGAVRWYGKAPFFTLSLASFLPIPIDVVRILSVSATYPRRLFVLATLAGRFPRYFLITILGHEMKLSNTAILIVLLITVAFGALQGISKIRTKNGANGNEQEE